MRTKYKFFVTFILEIACLVFMAFSCFSLKNSENINFYQLFAKFNDTLVYTLACVSIVSLVAFIVLTILLSLKKLLNRLMYYFALIAITISAASFITIGFIVGSMLWSYFAASTTLVITLIHTVLFELYISKGF